MDLPPRSPAFQLESAIQNRRHLFAVATQTRARFQISHPNAQFNIQLTGADTFCVCVGESRLALFAPAFLLVSGSVRISVPLQSPLHPAALCCTFILLQEMN